MTRRWVEPLEDPRVRRDAARFMAGIDKRDLLDVSTRLRRVHQAGPARLGRRPTGSSASSSPGGWPTRSRDARLVPVESGRTFVPLDEPERVAGEIARGFAPA